LAGDGIAKIGRDLRERFQYEPPFAKSRVRNDESGLVDHQISEQNQIEVERAGRVRMWTLAAARVLDRHQGIEHLPRRERRLADRRRVEEGRLRSDDADRIGFVIAGNFRMREERPKPGDREIEVRAPIADVAPQGDGRNDAIQWLDYSITRLPNYPIR